MPTSTKEVERSIEKLSFDKDHGIIYRPYRGEVDLPAICELVQSELSEPYTLYVYRYFLTGWPQLCFLACDEGDETPIGVIVCKQDIHKGRRNRGYIAMLSVRPDRRLRGIATRLVKLSIEAMKEAMVDEIVLETEMDNYGALSLYENLGFIRYKALHRFYFNAKSAFRLILPLPPRERQPNMDMYS